MKINQSDTSTLLVAITEAIQEGTVNKHGLFKLEDGWETKTLNALGAEFSKTLLNALDGSTLSLFVRDRLRYIKTESGSKSSQDTVNIIRVSCFSDPLKTARRIVGDLTNIPIPHRIITPIFQELSHRLTTTGISVKISDRLTIYSKDKIPETFKTCHSNDSIDSLIAGYHDHDNFDLQDDLLYIEYRASGYLSNRKTSRIVSEFYDEIRSFYGACIVYGIIIPNPNFYDEELEPFLVANSIVSDIEDLAYVERVDEDIARCANLATSSDTDDRIENGESLTDILSPVRAVFNKTNSEKLKTACAWNLRAHLSSRELDKILESAITIEVLMGDRETSDRIGLTKLMANRCAYAIGKNTEQRENIIKFFAEFYRVRSEVVHSGRTYLKNEERKIVDKGLDLATDVLRNEISISTDSKPI